MKRILVTAFGDFLGNDINSTKEFLKEMPNSKSLTKHIFNVGYFKNDFINIIKKNKPQKVVFLGMDNNTQFPKFETVAKNEMITLKNPFYRFFITIYLHWLKWNNKNFRTQKPLNKEILTVLPISKDKPPRIKLKSVVSETKEIKISNDAGNYVCNYSMWTVENYIRKKKLNIDFYFIHLPSKLTKSQKEDLIKFIKHLKR